MTNTCKTKRLQWWIPWLVGAVVATLVFVFAFTYTEMSFVNNDDTAILRSTMGYYGTLPTFHLYLNALLLYPLNWLTTAFSGIAWFTIMQIAFLWLSMAGIVRAMMCAFDNRQKCPWLGALVGILFVIACALSHCSGITYTITSALLSTAGIAQIMAVDAKNGSRGHVIRGMALALVYVVLAHSLRPDNTLPTILFCGVAFLWQWLAYRRHDAKPMWQSGLMVAIVFVIILGGRAIETQVKGMQDYLDWQEARIEVIDYGKLDNLPDELLEEIGWSQELYNVVKMWYFLDSNVSTEAFEAIIAYHDTLPSPSLDTVISDTTTQLETFWNTETLTKQKLLLFGALVLLCAFGLLGKRQNVLWHALALGLSLLGAVVMIVYLAYVGRIPERAVVSVLYPAMIIVLGLIPACLPSKGWLVKAEMAIIGALAVYLCVQCVTVTIDQVIPEVIINDENEGLNAFAALNGLALDWEEVLYITDDTLIADESLFPDVSEGMANNILFWGGWPCHSPEYTAMLARYGFDLDDIDGSDFIDNANVLLVRGMIEPLPTIFIAYLESLTGETVKTFLLDEWGGAYTFELYQ